MYMTTCTTVHVHNYMYMYITTCTHVQGFSISHRFGSPGNVEDTYNVFADYYMKTFNCSTSKNYIDISLSLYLSISVCVCVCLHLSI